MILNSQPPLSACSGETHALESFLEESDLGFLILPTVSLNSKPLLLASSMRSDSSK